MEIESLKKLMLIDNELKRRKKNDKLSSYNTKKVHKKQMEFHKCQKRNRWVFGGNRSGKSQCGAVETVWLARGIHPYRENKTCEGWVVSLTQQVQRDVAQRKILYYFIKLEKNPLTEKENFIILSVPTLIVQLKH